MIQDLNKFSGELTNSPPVDTIISDYQDKSFCFDWFKFTFSTINYDDNFNVDGTSFELLQELIRLLSGDKMFNEYDFERGNGYYKKSIVIDEGIFIFFYGPEDVSGNPTTMIELKGKGCLNFFKKMGILGWFKLFCWCLANQCNYKRLDNAIDDYSGKEMSLDKFIKYVEQYYFVSSIDGKVSTTKSYKSKDDGVSVEGSTAYVGTRSSHIQICAYDKKMERREKENLVSDEHKYHSRYEIRFYDHERILSLIQKFIFMYEDGLFNYCDYFMGILSGVITLKEYNPHDSNKSRWKDSPFWLEFINSCKKIVSYTNLNVTNSWDVSFDWVSRSCFNNLAKVYLVLGKHEFEKFIYNGIADKLCNFKDKELYVINRKLDSLKKAQLKKIDIQYRGEVLKNEFK